MKNSNLNQIFKLSLKNFFKNGNDFLWFNSKFLTLQKFLSSFYEKFSTIIPSRRTYTVSLSHLVIRSGTTSHNKTSVDKDVQANSSQRDIKARRKANPFDPYTETPSHLQKITTKTFYLWSSIDSKKTLNQGCEIHLRYIPQLLTSQFITYYQKKKPSKATLNFSSQTYLTLYPSTLTKRKEKEFRI